MTTEFSSSADSYLQRLKNGLTASAVLKAELGAIKSSCVKSKIFAYEGVDDKLFYAHWLSKINPDFDYEPFICRNKDQLIRLWNSLKHDLTGMGDGVYFFADRDFDELKGHQPDESIYLTDRYSIENYIVDSTVLSEILKIDLHCHGAADNRAEILSLFQNVYEEFLSTTSAINYRIYLARKNNIKQVGEISSRLDDLADVQLYTVKEGKSNPSEIVPLEREPSEEEISSNSAIFDTLEKRQRYRGKFALLFFKRWLALLLANKNSCESKLFNSLPQGDFSSKSQLSFDQLAARSRPPESFRQFIEKVFGKHIAGVVPG